MFKAIAETVGLIKCSLGFHGNPKGAVVVKKYKLGQRLRYDSYIACERCGEKLTNLGAALTARLVTPQGVVCDDTCTQECAERWCRAHPGWKWIPEGEKHE